MTITSRVQQQLFETTPSTSTRMIRIPQTRPGAEDESASVQGNGLSRSPVGAPWTQYEHERFLEGLELFPAGPWRRVAEYIGTKNARQAMTHAQKYRQKIGRHARGLQTKVRDVTQSSPMVSINEGPDCADDVLTATLQSSASESLSDVESATCVSELTLATSGVDDERMDWRSSAMSIRAISGDDDTSALFEELMSDVNNLADQQLLRDSAALLRGAMLNSFSTVPEFGWEPTLVPSSLPVEFVNPSYELPPFECLSPMWATTNQPSDL
ncbi:Myb-like dna-binding protein, partial [Globisporangium splendens]